MTHRKQQSNRINLIKMEKLMNNALNQLKLNGKIVVTIYPNRNYNEPYHITCKTFHEAAELISSIYDGITDDLHVSNF